MRFDEFVLREYGGSNGTMKDLAQYWRGEVPSFPFLAAGALVVATIKGVSIHRPVLCQIWPFLGQKSNFLGAGSKTFGTLISGVQ